MLIFLTFLFIICKNFPISHPDHSLNLCEIKDMLEMVLFYKNATAKENLFIFTKCCIIYKYKLNYKNKKSVTLNNLIMELKLLIEILLSNNQDINWIENYNKIIKAVVELNEALCKFIMKNQNKKGIKYSKKMIDKLNSTIIYKSENIKKYLYRKKVIKKLFLSKNIKKNEEIYLDYLAECKNIPEYFDILSRKNQTKLGSKKTKQKNNSKEILKEISNFYEFNTICINN